MNKTPNKGHGNVGQGRQTTDFETLMSDVGIELMLERYEKRRTAGASQIAALMQHGVLSRRGVSYPTVRAYRRRASAGEEPFSSFFEAVDEIEDDQVGAFGEGMENLKKISPNLYLKNAHPELYGACLEASEMERFDRVVQTEILPGLQASLIEVVAGQVDVIRQRIKEEGDITSDILRTLVADGFANIYEGKSGEPES